MQNRIKKTAAEIIASNSQETSPLSTFMLMAHNIRSLHNVGALFRSADIFGIERLILSGFTPAPPDPAITKTALGAEESVEWTRTEDPIKTLSELKINGYRIYGLEQTWSSERLTDHRPDTRKVCLVIGNEVTGIDPALLDAADHCLEIPQYGKKHSLNVSVAAGIAIYAFLERFQ